MKGFTSGCTEQPGGVIKLDKSAPKSFLQPQICLCQAEEWWLHQQHFQADLSELWASPQCKNSLGFLKILTSPVPALSCLLPQGCQGAGRVWTGQDFGVSVLQWMIPVIIPSWGDSGIPWNPLEGEFWLQCQESVAFNGRAALAGDISPGL